MPFDFQDLIRKDRDSKQYEPFEGSFLEYLSLIKNNPELAVLAHERMYKLIVSLGFEAIKTEDNQRLKRIYGKETIKKYKFFENEFYGIDKTIMEIVRYFHSAAMRGKNRDRYFIWLARLGRVNPH